MAIVKARYVKKGVATLTGIYYASWAVTPVKIEDPGSAGVPGRVAAAVTYRDVVVRLYGRNLAALLALIASTKENVIIGYQNSAGANRKMTVKNVRFTKPLGTHDIKAKDAGGKIAMYGVEGHGCWLSTDTLALMVVDATDT